MILFVVGDVSEDLPEGRSVSCLVEGEGEEVVTEALAEQVPPFHQVIPPAEAELVALNIGGGEVASHCTSQVHERMVPPNFVVAS